MPDTARSLIRHAAAAACLLLLFAAASAAQQPDQPVVSAAQDAPQFLPRADFHMAISVLSDPDIRFSWDTHFGGSADVVDYVVGRAGVYVDYEALLGDEFRIFDPNQGNYTLEGFASARTGPATEVMGIFHHVSRHLSDRPKRFAIAWNLLGARVLHQIRSGDAVFDIDLEGGAVIQHSYVDYRWIGEAHLRAQRQMNPYAAVYGRAIGQWFGVNGEVAGRGRQVGGSLEGGVRLNGRGRSAIMELFAGIERRVDADPLDRQPQHWALAGIRLLSR